MATRPLKPCAWPGCRALTAGQPHCTLHVPKAEQRRQERVKRANKRYNENRDSTDARYKQEKWRRLSIRFRRMHPLCAQCELEGRITPSQLVDHIKPSKTHPELFFDWRNLRALCHSCHNRVGEKVGLVCG